MTISASWIIATDSGSYWGRSWGADGITFVKANAYRYDSPELAAQRIGELKAKDGTRTFHVEELPPGKRWNR
jgi:hypothetical protein